MTRLMDIKLVDALRWCWTGIWKAFVWVLVYNVTAYSFGIETTWWLFGLCCITGFADRLLYWPDSPIKSNESGR